VFAEQLIVSAEQLIVSAEQLIVSAGHEFMRAKLEFMRLGTPFMRIGTLRVRLRTPFMCVRTPFVHGGISRQAAVPSLELTCSSSMRQVVSATSHGTPFEKICRVSMIASCTRVRFE
jgi:hypothetical protein